MNVLLFHDDTELFAIFRRFENRQFFRGKEWSPSEKAENNMRIKMANLTKFEAITCK